MCRRVKKKVQTHVIQTERSINNSRQVALVEGKIFDIILFFTKSLNISICSGLRKQRVVSPGIIRLRLPDSWASSLRSAPAPARPLMSRRPPPCPQGRWPPPPPASLRQRPRRSLMARVKASVAGLGSMHPSCLYPRCTCSSGTCFTTPATTPASSPGWTMKEDASRYVELNRYKLYLRKWQICSRFQTRNHSSF